MHFTPFSLVRGMQHAHDRKFNHIDHLRLMANVCAQPLDECGIGPPQLSAETR